MTESRNNPRRLRRSALSAMGVGGVLLWIMLTASDASRPATVEGVSFRPEVAAADATLRLRGCGLMRYMVFIKAYVAALYLPEAARSEGALSDIPKHLEIEYFHAIPAQDFAKATSASISRNTSLTGFQRLKPTVEEFNALYRDIAPGDRYALTYRPGSGTTLSWNGQALGTVAGAEFAAELFGIWLGPTPLDNDLKRLLLGE